MTYILLSIPLIATTLFYLKHKDLKMTANFFALYTIAYIALLGLIVLVNITAHYIMLK